MGHLPGASSRSGDPVRVEPLDGGRIASIALARPPGNVLDRGTVARLREAFASEAVAGAHAVLLHADGEHFSYGASIEDHLPERIGPFLAEFHALARELTGRAPPIVAAVRGRCLGGGLELALLAQRIVAGRDARFAFPEVKLGVFAPLGSLLLPLRIGAGAASDLLLTGRSIPAEESLRARLADEVAGDPREAALAWIRAQLLPLSRASLRFVAAAARAAAAAALRASLAELERLYVDELAGTPDAIEGIRAFLDKRAPRYLS